MPHRYERIDKLKNSMLRGRRYVSIEQAKITTRVYREHEAEPTIVKRALALKYALEEMPISIEPEELIVGNRTVGPRHGVVSPESGSAWLDRELESLPTRPQDPFEVHPGDIADFRQNILPFWKGRSLEDAIRKVHGDEIAAISKVVKINQTDHAQGHICPDCKTWLRLGPSGLRSLAVTKSATGPEDKRAFYRAVLLTMEGAAAFMLRYRDRLRSEAAKPENKPHRADLLEAARVCDALVARPARTFHEAVQSIWFLFVILQMESNASSFSPGRLDQILYPYYRSGIDAGTLTDERALELIECLWLKFNQIVYMRNASSAKYFAGFPIGFNIVIGGQDPDGDDFANELSHLFLTAQEHLLLPQPNLSVRLHAKTDEALLRHAVRVVAKGSGMPQFFNDESIIPALRDALDVNEADARDYAVVGCVELTTQGNFLGWSDAAMFNLNKALELALNHGRCLMTGEQLGPDTGSLSDYQTYADLENAFAKQIDWFVDKMVVACAEVERAHQELLPTPFLSSVVDDCLEKGIDVTAGGAQYNFSGIQMIQVANLADSLAAIRQIVYEERRITADELLTALRDNFRGHEPLRQTLLNKAPKYGNDVEWVDELGRKWARYFRERLGRYQNERGGPYHTGMYTVSAHVPMGENVGASPDGRRGGEPLADGGLSPVYGRDVQGPTAVLKSVSRLDNDLTSNGGLLNMKFLPEFFATEGGVDRFCQFLRAFVDLHIPHIQFNVVRTEDLVAAKTHPEQYRSLTVRVAGYTAYFTELAGSLQDEIIARTSYGKM